MLRKIMHTFTANMHSYSCMRDYLIATADIVQTRQSLIAKIQQSFEDIGGAVAGMRIAMHNHNVDTAN